MIGETVPAVVAAAVISEVIRHGKASVFQADFPRERNLTGVGEDGRDERTSWAASRPVLSLIVPSRPLRSSGRVISSKHPAR